MKLHLLFAFFFSNTVSCVHGRNFKRELQASASTSLPTATESPVCVQPRSPSDPLAVRIAARIANEKSISKACSVTDQNVTTIANNNGSTLSVIYYGINDAYFFNTSHNSMHVSRPVVGPAFCSDTFTSIFNACVTGSKFWGGWIVVDGTNHSSRLTDVSWCLIFMIDNPLLFQSQITFILRIP